MINYTSNRQLSFSEFQTPFRNGLDPQNRWIRLSQLIPWDELVNIYARTLSPDFGRPTLDARIEVGALIIQHILTLSDEELVEQIRENPYLQYFLGYSDYSYRQVFDPSLLVSIRQRLGAAAMLEMNELVTDHIESTAKQTKAPKQDSHKNNPGKTNTSKETSPGADDSQKGKDDPEPPHRGKLLLDATVAPADIKYPTDLDLLNEARVHSEGIIDLLWQPGKEKVKPRTYRRKARKSYLSVVKKRKKSKGIRYSGKSLGRPPVKSDLYAAARQQQRQDNRSRSRIEGCFGLGKRKYGLELVMTKTRLTSETYIGAVFLAMNLIQGLNKLSHVLYLYFSAVWQGWLPRLWALKWACQVILAIRSSNTTITSEKSRLQFH